MKEGIAAAVAMGSAPMPSAGGRLSYAVNGARFRGQNALGGDFKYRLNSEAPVAIGAGFSYGGGRNSAVRVGVAGEF
jgi:hypothetical protein